MTYVLVRYWHYIRKTCIVPTCTCTAPEKFNCWTRLWNVKSLQKLFGLLDKRLIAFLRLKNERGERLSSHRSDHVTRVWGGLHNLCNVQRIFPHLGVQQVQLCSQPSHPFIPIVIMHVHSICKLFFSLCTMYGFYSDIFALNQSKIEHKTVAELYWNYWLHTPACKLIPLFLLCDNSVRIVHSLMQFIWHFNVNIQVINKNGWHVLKFPISVWTYNNWFVSWHTEERSSH